MVHRRLTALLLLMSGGLALPAEPQSDLRRRSFVPTGWEAGDCPPTYGADAVLCAGTDTGPFKVDRHIPTVSIQAPTTSCAETEKALLAHWEGRLSVARRTTGRCGPSGAACTEIRFRDGRPVDPVAALVYLLCPANGPVEVVSYGVSARVIDRFEPVARAQAGWNPGR